MHYYCVGYNMTVILSVLLVIITIHPCGQASRTKHANDTVCPKECQCQFSGSYSSSAKCHLHRQSLSNTLYNLSSKIQILDLTSNRIKDAQIQEYNDDVVIKNNSHGAQNLHSLDLSFNQIQRIPMDTFSSLRCLDHLSLKANHISTIENLAFANLSTLQILNLAWNFIDSFNNKMLLGLDTLKDLNLSINAISNISGQPFITTGNLRTLDLNHNLIQSVSRTTFTGLSQLKNLLLRNNQITQIDAESFVHLTSLVHLDLSLNRISKLRALTFWGCQRLTSLNLSYSGVTVIERRAFLGLDSLRTLTLEGNLIHILDNGAFLGLQQLQTLSLYNMPNLRILREGALFGMPMLERFYLNNNHRLSFLPKYMMLKFPHLTYFDARNNSLTTIVESTFQNASTSLEHIYLSGNPYQCDCWMMWLVTNVYSVQDRVCISRSNNFIPTVIDRLNNSSNYQIHNTSCLPVSDYDSIVCQLPWLPAIDSVNKLSQLNSTDLRCERPQLTTNHSTQQPDPEFHKIGSSVYLFCNVTREPEPEIVWILPNHRSILVYHRYHPDTVEHLPGASDVLMPSGSYHTQHYWHLKRRYISDHDNNRVTLLKDGRLYIDYILRTDAGRYTCIATTPMGNVSMTTVIRLDYKLKQIKWISLLIGWSLAFFIFFLALFITLISNLATRCINQRKRETIKTLIDNIDAYKSAQFDKIKVMGATHMGKFRDQYNHQLKRLGENYNRNVIRIKENCAGQMERLRDSYITQLSRIKDYSSQQLEKVRDNYHSQMIKIREYGSTQVDKLREQYKLQQQHIIKLLETMNLENCKTIMETECVRTDSMLFDQTDIMLDIAADMPMLRTPSDLSTSGYSEYMTAPSGISLHSNTSFTCNNDRMITDHSYPPHTPQSDYNPDDNPGGGHTFMPSVIVSARSLPSSLNSLEPQHLHTNQLSQSEVLSDLHRSHAQTPHINSHRMTDIRNLEASIDNLFSLESEISSINSELHVEKIDPNTCGTNKPHEHSSDTTDREIILTSGDLERYMRETSV